MAAILDTNVVVRYLVGDPAELAARAAAIIDNEPDLAIPSVVLTETAYVLASVYSVPREEIVDRLIELVQKKNLRPLEFARGTAIQALLLCRGSARVSFADAMIWAAALAPGIGVVYSFDERFPAAGIELRAAPA